MNQMPTEWGPYGEHRAEKREFLTENGRSEKIQPAVFIRLMVGMRRFEPHSFLGVREIW